MDALFSMNNNVCLLRSVCVPGIVLGTLLASSYFVPTLRFSVMIFFPLCFNIVFSFTKTLSQLL